MPSWFLPGAVVEFSVIAAYTFLDSWGTMCGVCFLYHAIDLGSLAYRKIGEG